MKETAGIFSDKDLDDAVSKIKEEFSTWKGCELHSIRYAGDDICTGENLEWMRSLGDGKEYAQCICFLSDFHSPKEERGAWEPDSEYTDWSWWLARTEGGEWELLTWGYG
ncbi:MAG: hypothetical protein IJM62_04365 [Lachnospiraceae bacterium]|nr:hypothetical protein [Lachnospiraceae bacterium]